MRLALYQPDIPQNTGTLLRLGACLGVPVDIIEPCGFVLDDKRLRRAGMDYLDMAQMHRHTSWSAFLQAPAIIKNDARLVLLSTHASDTLTDFRFSEHDVLLMGRESAGVPEEVHRRADARIRIPQCPGTRSLNLAVAATLALGEALRQTEGYPNPYVESRSQK